VSMVCVRASADCLCEYTNWEVEDVDLVVASGEWSVTYDVSIIVRCDVDVVVGVLLTSWFCDVVVVSWLAIRGDTGCVSGDPVSVSVCTTSGVVARGTAVITSVEAGATSGDLVTSSVDSVPAGCGLPSVTVADMSCGFACVSVDSVVVDVTGDVLVARSDWVGVPNDEVGVSCDNECT